MKFLIDFNEKLIKRMFFYKNFSKETFTYKKFSSKKSLIDKIILQGHFRKNTVIKKKDILKKSIVSQLISNNKSIKIFNSKKNPNIKLGTITNILNEIPEMKKHYFLQKWYFLLDPFFLENEIVSIIGPKSVKKTFDSFKSLKLLNSRLITSNFFNFNVSIKIIFHDDNLSQIFYKNYES